MKSPQKLLQRITTYKYFVHYQFAGGFGMIELTMSLPIRGMDDVHAAIKEIKRLGKIKSDVVITNWILL
jgi:hypothetical protein